MDRPRPSYSRRQAGRYYVPGEPGAKSKEILDEIPSKRTSSNQSQIYYRLICASICDMCNVAGHVSRSLRLLSPVCWGKSLMLEFCGAVLLIAKYLLWSFGKSLRRHPCSNTNACIRGETRATTIMQREIEIHDIVVIAYNISGLHDLLPRFTPSRKHRGVRVTNRVGIPTIAGSKWGYSRPKL